MKQKDVVLIIVVVFISTVLSFLLSNYIITSPKNRGKKVEVVTPITADFKTPDKTYFNENSVNPTKVIQIGDDPNQSPFSGGN